MIEPNITKIINYQRKNKIKLIKKNNYKCATIKFSKYRYKEHEYLKKLFIDKINNFIKTISFNFPLISLNRFKTNFKKFNFCVYNNKVNDSIYGGTISFKMDEFTCYEEEAIEHELLHMATGTYNHIKRIEYCGFDLINYKKKYRIGRGINEGYTDLLTNRYFGAKIGYQIEALLSHNLELLIGHNTMEKLYFNMDIYGLIDEISKYSNYVNACDFIHNLDKLSFKLTKLKSEEEIKEIRDLYLKTVTFLFYCLYNKYSNNGKLDILINNTKQLFDENLSYTYNGFKINLPSLNDNIYNILLDNKINKKIRK